MTFPYPKHPASCHAKTVIPSCTNCRAALRAVAIKDAPTTASRACNRCGAKYQVKTSWEPMPKMQVMIVRTEISQIGSPTSCPTPKA